MRKTLPAVILAAFLLAPVLAFGSSREITFSGKTMGTTYQVTIVAEAGRSAENLQEKIDQELESINQSMSTYRKDSEISRFNDLRETEKKFIISDDFQEVLRVARTVHQLTGGAWDGTVTPLVKLWGFMSEKLPSSIPDKKEIQRILPHVGFNKIIISGNNYMLKKDPQTTLDLGSIAKGHGVDKISGLLLKEGFQNFIVEIGGEIYASGANSEGGPWRVGINTPDKTAPSDLVYKTFTLADMAMATSGDYRSLIEIDGHRYSHVINPKTGYPVQTGVTSASVFARTCTFADGLATAVMVMGVEKSLELINRLSDVEALIVVRNTDGTFTDHYSDGLIP